MEAEGFFDDVALTLVTDVSVYLYSLRAEGRQSLHHTAEASEGACRNKLDGDVELVSRIEKLEWGESKRGGQPQKKGGRSPSSLRGEGGGARARHHHAHPNGVGHT